MTTTQFYIWPNIETRYGTRYLMLRVMEKSSDEDFPCNPSGHIVSDLYSETPKKAHGMYLCGIGAKAHVYMWGSLNYEVIGYQTPILIESFSLDAREAVAVAKTLRAMEKEIAKLSDPDVAEVAEAMGKAIGAAGFCFPKDPKVDSYSRTEWEFLGWNKTRIRRMEAGLLGSSVTA